MSLMQPDDSRPLDAAALLRAALAADGARPFITFYDDATGERTEMSVATTANWVAKTANLITDELVPAPGARVGLALPVHWQLPVWQLACWSLGLTVVALPEDDPAATPDGAPVDVVVTGPEGAQALEGTGTGGAGDILVTALLPLARPSAQPLLPGALDLDRTVLSQPDLPPSAPAPAAGEVALVDGAGAGTTYGVLGAAVTAAADRSRRVLTASRPLAPALAVAAVLGPLATGGSLVLCRRPGEGLAARMRTEGVDVELDGEGRARG